MNLDHWVLDGHEVRRVPLLEWAMKFEDGDSRRVAKTQVGDTEVSTVFLGIDHNFGDDGPPLLFESMTFPDQMTCERYATWDEAQAGHDRIVAALREGRRP